VRRRLDTGESVHIGFIDEHGREVDRHELALLRTAAHPDGPS
jgi:hypothetical protein